MANTNLEMIWFDLGNVLLTFSRQQQAAALAQLPGCSREPDAILQYIDGNSAEHLAYESGTLSRQAFLASLANFLGASASLEDVEQAYSDLFTPNEPVCQLLKRLAKFVPVGLATNSDPSHYARVARDHSDVISHFSESHIVTSFAAGARKPSPLFYQRLITAAGRAPQSLLFIDDLAANVAGARAEGIQAVVYTSPSDLVAEFQNRGIDIAAG